LLSVIIPTYNRKGVLVKCLNALFHQTCLRSVYEVLVVDDGSTDGTEEVMRKFAASAPVKFRYCRQEHKGPAAARNVGIRNARGKIILFIGDDIIATPNLLEEHLKWHAQYPEDNVAVLGYVTWSPGIEVTPFMYWLENGGPQFKFYQIADQIKVNCEYFVTSNVSLKRRFLLKNGAFFDEDFPYASYEDVELAYRLDKLGMKLLYNKNAIGYHSHYMSLDDACRRMEKVGESMKIYARKVPTAREPELWKRILRRVFLNDLTIEPLKKLASYCENKYVLHRFYYELMFYYLYKGVFQDNQK